MPLSETAIKRQADNLQRSLKKVYGLISDRYTVFRELCRVVNPERGYSLTAVKEIKERYKEINAKFTEARTLYQMLRAKYKGYIQIDSQLLREIEDLSLMYRKDYRFFEHTHTTWEQREQKARAKNGAPQRILSHLHEVYLERPSFPSLILYFKGDAASLEVVKSKMRLGTMDMCERGEDEMWFVLTGIRSSSDEILQKKLLETLFQGLSTIRGIAVKVNTEHDAREEVLGDIPSVIDELQDGEIKIL